MLVLGAKLMPSRCSASSILVVVLLGCKPSVVASPEGSPAKVLEAEKAASTEAIDLDGVHLQLKDCALIYGRQSQPQKTYELGVPPPCRFARIMGGGIRVVDTAKGKSLLIESSRPASQDEPGYSRGDCDTRLIVVVVSASEVLLSTDRQRIAQCAPNEWDEKVFHIFSASAKPLPAP
jgi:hypothetical protein